MGIDRGPREPSAAERAALVTDVAANSDCVVCGRGEGLEMVRTRQATIVICVDPTPCLNRAGVVRRG